MNKKEPKVIIKYQSTPNFELEFEKFISEVLSWLEKEEKSFKKNNEGKSNNHK